METCKNRINCLPSFCGLEGVVIGMVIGIVVEGVSANKADGSTVPFSFSYISSCTPTTPHVVANNNNNNTSS